MSIGGMQLRLNFSPITYKFCSAMSEKAAEQ